VNAAEPIPPAAPDSLQHAPQLLIHYEFKEGRELLTFSNDGGSAAHNVQISPLMWTEKRKVELLSAPPPLRVQQKHTTWIFFEKAPQHVYELYSFMRSDTPRDADTRVVATYTDGKGNRFEREFMLTTYPDKTITWVPGPVKLI